MMHITRFPDSRRQNIIWPLHTDTYSAHKTGNSANALRWTLWNINNVVYCFLKPVAELLTNMAGKVSSCGFAVGLLVH